MILDRVAWRRKGDVVELSARARPEARGADPVVLWLRSSALPGEGSPADASPFLPALLLWCMAAGEPLSIDAEVSQRLLESTDEVAAVCASFWPALMRPVAVAAAGRPLAPGSPHTACFFSRGVDSWYSVLTARDRGERPPLTRLVHLPGRDLPPNPGADLLERSLRAVGAASDEAGLELVTLDCNVFEALPRRVDWNTLHGAVMAGAGLALGPARILVPGSVVGDRWFPWGSHPKLDPLFSTERTEVVHHASTHRLEKVRRVARSPTALRWLRVCHRRTERNCGRCEKCLRTMAELHVVGALESCPAFDRELDTAAVATTSTGVGGRVHWSELLSELGNRRRDRELAGAIELALLKSELKEVRSRVAEVARSARASGATLPAGADVDEARRALRAAITAVGELAAAYPPADSTAPAPPDHRGGPGAAATPRK